MTELERQRLIALGFDPDQYTFSGDNAGAPTSVAVKPTPISVSPTGAFTRSLARGALPSLAAGGAVAGIGTALDLTGIGAPVGIPLTIAGAGLAGYGARRLQEAVAPSIIPGYTESEQADIQAHPFASTLGELSSTVFGGLNPSIRNIPRAARAIRDISVGVKPAATEIQNLANVGLGAIIPPAQQTAISLATGEGLPSLSDLLTSAAGGAVFSKPNVIGTKLLGFHPTPEAPRIDLNALRKAQAGASDILGGETGLEKQPELNEAAVIKAAKDQAELDRLTEIGTETGKVPPEEDVTKPGKPAATIPGFESVTDQLAAQQKATEEEHARVAAIAKAEAAAQRTAEAEGEKYKLSQ